MDTPPASAGVAASTPSPPAETSTSGKALQDDFAKHWQGSGTAPVGDDEDVDNDADSAAEKDDEGKKEGDTGRKEEEAVPTRVVVTTWTVGGQTYTGTATPRGGGVAAASSGSGGVTKSGDKPSSTAGGVQAAEKTGSGESDELKDEGAAKGDHAGVSISGTTMSETIV